MGIVYLPPISFVKGDSKAYSPELSEISSRCVEIRDSEIMEGLPFADSPNKSVLYWIKCSGIFG